MTSKGDHIRLEKGTVVKQHYEVVTSVGSGNFSKVYRVLDLQLPAKEQKRKPLAMKVIKKEYSSDAKYEKQMLIALHKNDKNHTARVSKMYECFVYQECPVFIMPIHGASIRNRRLGINRGVVTHEKLLEFAFDILETMDFVHFQCCMVHTDLKPENILISDCNVPENSLGDEWVVCDFGSASLWRMDKLDSDLISTRPYRAPEVVLGNKWHYAADMWSVGCILYEVAVGHRLFEVRDDLTHLHMMERRIGKLPEAFTKGSKYASKFFNARGDFLSTPDIIRFGKCRLTPLREMFRDDEDFWPLLEGLLIYDPSRRMTATEALTLPMFDKIRVERQKRREREAKEAEARRQRRRAAAAAANSTHNATGSDSLMSNVNSMAGTTNPHLHDRADGNVLNSTDEGKKMPRATAIVAKVVANNVHLGETLPSTVTSSTDGAAAVTGDASDSAESPAVDSRMRGHARVADVDSAHASALAEVHQTDASRTCRSATETTASRLLLSVPSGKEIGKPRSNTGSAALHSTTASPSGPPANARATEKMRLRAASTPASMPKGSSSSSSSAAAHISSTVSSSAAASVVTKDVPSNRPVVEYHRASVEGISTTCSANVVPTLALSKLMEGDTPSSPAMSTSGSASKGIRTSGNSIKNGIRQSDRKPAQRTASPAERSPNRAKTSSAETPRKLGRTPRLDSGASVDATDASVKSVTPDHPSSEVLHTHDSAAAASVGLTRNVIGGTPVAPVNGARAATAHPHGEAIAKKSHMPLLPSEQRPQHNAASPSTSPVVAAASCVKGDGTTPVALQLGPSAAATTVATAGAAAPTPKVSVTPMRASSATPVGYQSPLKRGVTAVGITSRTEPPTHIESPDTEQEVEKGDGRETDGDREDTVDESDRDPAAKTSEGEDEGSSSGEVDWNKPPSCGATNPDGSPRATDYRSPVRNRPPVVVPIDDISTPTSPEATRRSGVYASVSSEEWTSMENASHQFAATSKKTMEKLHTYTLPLKQPAPVAGRAGSPITVARRSQHTSSAADQAATTACTKGSDTNQLASAVPIVRASLSHGNSRSGSLAGTMVSTTLPDALARTAGQGSSAAVSAPHHEASPAPAGGYPIIVRSPQNSSGTLRGSAPRTRPSSNLASASAAATTCASTVPSASSTCSPTSTAAASSATPAVMLPSTKSGVDALASVDCLKVVLPSNIADVRGPSTTTASASPRTVVKQGPSGSVLGNSNVAEHPSSRFLTPLPSAPQGSNGVSHPPEVVTRSRERALVVEAAEKESAAPRRGSTNSPKLSVSSLADAATPKTPLPSTAAAGGAPTGTASLSLSLSSTSSHPTVGVVRQRSGSTHLVPALPASGVSVLEGNPAFTASQLGVYTPRGSRVLQEHQALCSNRSSTQISAIHSGNISDENGGGRAPASPPPPSSGSRTSLSIGTPRAVKADGDPLHSGSNTDRTGVLTIDNKPTTPRGSGRASPKPLNSQQLRASTTTSGGAAGGTRQAGNSGSGGRSPRYSTTLGMHTAPTAISHGGQTALNSSTSSLHLGVMRSPRKPVAPGASSNMNTSSNNGSAFLMASVDGTSAVPACHQRQARRAASCSRGPGARGEQANAISPRRAPSSPRTKPHTTTGVTAGGNSSSVAAAEPTAPTSSLATTAPASLNVPTQVLDTKTASMQGATRLAQPRRPMTIISSKPSSSVALSRYFSSAVVAPTRNSASRPQPRELVASTNKMQPANGFNAPHRQPSTTTAGSASPSASTAASSGSNPNRNSVTEWPNSSPMETASTAAKYRRDARTLKRIVVRRPSPQSSSASMVSLQELGEEDASSSSPATSRS
ncbi:protein kinase-like protein [Leptomonas seymouri]|uniref:Protein kinase-like protein n=1 Tax=Leptomonas seymouri TaxID=5684 RepID=A0A0N0P5J4_LEPSE|nr:protein kinase-like protein [Leptomonas seymouri]|eukprot:KPI86057.1 protein kinase-like protein [Leptomonas seymouri]